MKGLGRVTTSVAGSGTDFGEAVGGLFNASPAALQVTFHNRNQGDKMKTVMVLVGVFLLVFSENLLACHESDLAGVLPAYLCNDCYVATHVSRSNGSSATVYTEAYEHDSML